MSGKTTVGSNDDLDNLSESSRNNEESSSVKSAGKTPLPCKTKITNKTPKKKVKNKKSSEIDSKDDSSTNKTPEKKAKKKKSSEIDSEDASKN